jgi:hypothetical protein
MRQDSTSKQNPYTNSEATVVLIVSNSGWREEKAPSNLKWLLVFRNFRLNAVMIKLQMPNLVIQ